MTQNNLNDKPYFYPFWEKYQGRGVLAQSQLDYDAALVQFSIAAFVLVVDGLPVARLCRAQSLVSLANVYLLMERSDRALPLLKEAMSLRSGLIPPCHSLTAETLHMMANAHRGMRQYVDADECYRLACEYLCELLPIDDPHIEELIGDWLVSNAEWKARADLTDYAQCRLSA